MKSLLFLLLACLAMHSMAQNGPNAPDQLFQLAQQSKGASKNEIQQLLGAPQHQMPNAAGESWAYVRDGFQLRYHFDAQGSIQAFEGNLQAPVIQLTALPANFPAASNSSEWQQQLGAPHGLSQQDGRSSWSYRFTDVNQNLLRVELKFDSVGQLLPNGLHAQWQYSQSSSIPVKKLAKLQMGKTTQKQAVRLLGQPNEKSLDAFQANWRYRNPNAFLELKFNEKGILQEMMFGRKN